MVKIAVSDRADAEGASAAARKGPRLLGIAGGAFESLSIPDYRWLWMSSLGSFMAMNMQMVARVWLVLELADDSPFAVALVTMSFALPMMFVSAVAGALADRVPKRRLMLLGQSGNAVMTLIIATLDVTGYVAFWHIMVSGVVSGSLMALNMPSRQAPRLRDSAREQADERDRPAELCDERYADSRAGGGRLPDSLHRHVRRLLLGVGYLRRLGADGSPNYGGPGRQERVRPGGYRGRGGGIPVRPRRADPAGVSSSWRSYR